MDILAGRVYRDRVLDDGALVPVRVYELPWTVGMIAPIEGDEGWLLGAGRGFVHLAPDGTHRTIAEVSPAGTRMNDGACDPQGRFWAGTLADDHHAGGGALYRLDRDGPDGAGARRPDDPQRRGLEPRRSDDVPRGQRPARRPRVHVRPGARRHLRRTGPGHRARGGRLTRRHDGGRRGRPVGRDLRRRAGSAVLARGRAARGTPVPARQSTCCAFAGPGLHRLYVTTATENWTDEQRRAEPGAAWSTGWTLTATGLPAASFRPEPGWWAETIS